MNYKLIIIFYLFISYASWGHSGHYQEIGWWTWNFSATVVAGLFAMCGLYFLGYLNTKSQTKSRRNLIYFTLSMVVLIIALLSPVDVLSDKLGSVHMVQHTLLMMVAAPLMAIATPARYIVLAIPSSLRRHLWFSWWIKTYQFRRPIFIWLLYALILWIWHLPYLYETALANEWIHDIQHLGFFVSSFLFWRVVLDPQGSRFLNPGLSVIYLFVASLHAMMLGVFMALSTFPWYGPYITTAPLYGLSPLEDQQIAGYIMWMPAGVSYFIVAVSLMLKIISPKKVTYLAPRE